MLLPTTQATTWLLMAQPPLAPRVAAPPICLLDSTSSGTQVRPKPAALTAKGRRTEIDGSPAGEGGLAAAIVREAKARALPPPPAAVQSRIDAAFFSSYDQVEVNALWANALDAYGSAERASEAVLRQPFLLNPTYTWPPPLLRRSKDALVEVLGSESDALDVMRKNPSILQCGANGILGTGPEEIRLWANVRDTASRVPPPVAASLGVSFLSLIFLNLLIVRIDDPAIQGLLSPLFTASKALLGLSFALAIEGSRVVIVGSVLKSSLRQRDDEAAAAAGEAARRRSQTRRAKVNAESGWQKLGRSLISRAASGVDERGRSGN